MPPPPNNPKGLDDLLAENPWLGSMMERFESLPAAEQKLALAGLMVDESKARQYSRDLQSILNAMPSMIGSWDRNQRNRFANAAYESWFGVDPGQSRGLHIREVIGEERYRLNLPYIEGVLRGEPQEFERDIPAPDDSGMRRSLARYIPDIIDGKVAGFFVQVADVTAIKQAETALFASEAQLYDRELRFRTLFEAAPIGIFMLSPDLLLLNVNTAFCRLLGYGPEELHGRSIIDLTHPDDRQETLAATSDMVDGALLRSTAEKRYLTKDGQPVWVSITRAAVRDAHGAMLYGIGTVQDITERREAERLRMEHLDHQRYALVREVHHRIKNNLQGVISLIEQLKYNQPQSADALEEAATQIGAIAVVHGLYSHPRSAEIHPRQLIEAIVTSIARISSTPIYSRPGHEIPGWEWRLSTRDTISIALVVNELIYNAIKHAGADARVEVAYGSESGAFALRVFNRPASLPPGFDFTAGIGLGTGLSLVSSLLPPQGARLTIKPLHDGVEAVLHLTHPCANATPPTPKESQR